MRYSTENQLQSATLSLNDCTIAFGSKDALDDTNTRRAIGIEQTGATDCELVFTFSAPGYAIDVVSLVGISSAVTDIEIETRDGVGAVIQTVAATIETPIQQNYVTAFFDGSLAEEVRVRFDAGSGNTVALGYAYMGRLSTPVNIAALNYSVSAADPQNITRAGTSLTTTTYLFADLSMTLVEETFSDIRERIVAWASAGYATPRFWYFEAERESCILTGETLYAILDSQTLQLDPIHKPGSEAPAQTTLGLVEVF